MSSPVRMEERVKQITFKNRILAIFCANLSFFLIKLPPNSLANLLSILIKETKKPKPQEVLEWRTAIVSTNVRYAGNGCLQRSVAVMLWGAFYRKTPTWISGFQVSPFIAHAWVEVDGVPIGEEMDLDKFHKILSVEGGKGL